MPFGTSEDWFMIEETPILDRVVFPSCVKLRISYTSTTCEEWSSLYQLNMLTAPSSWLPGIDWEITTSERDRLFMNTFEKAKQSKKYRQDRNLVEYVPDAVLKMCKPDFIKIYKNEFTKILNENPRSLQKE